MNDSEDAARAFPEAIDPADAFAALADGTRVGILRALWEAEDGTAAFSELREAIGARDSGGFNYHLDKLTDHFVRKADGTYTLTLAGRHVVGGLLEGAYTQTGSVEPVPLDRPCPFCGGERTFYYEDETVTIGCDGCSHEAYFEVAPGVFAGHDDTALPTVARRYLRVMLFQAASGFCPYCEGRFAASLIPDAEDGDGDEDAAHDEPGPYPMARYECVRCGQEMLTDLGTALLFEPAVVAFFEDHGVDVHETPLAEFVATREDTVVRREMPPEAEVSFDAGGDRLRLTVDGSLSVLDVTRGE